MINSTCAYRMNASIKRDIIFFESIAITHEKETKNFESLKLLSKSKMHKSSVLKENYILCAKQRARKLREFHVNIIMLLSSNEVYSV